MAPSGDCGYIALEMLEIDGFTLPFDENADLRLDFVYDRLAVRFCQKLVFRTCRYEMMESLEH
jgi:hypothetical protein